MSWLKLYTWTSGLGTHLDTHFVVPDKVVIPFGPALYAHMCTQGEGEKEQRT